MQTEKPLWRRLLRLLILAVSVLLVLMLSGLLLADHLTPARHGTPSQALPVQPDATAIDRSLQPLQDQHPGQTGVALLSDGLDAYAARALITRHAGRSLDLQYYIWNDDLVGHLLARDLHDAAERGVRVRLLLDDLSTKDKDALLLALDAHPNIELRVYNPFRNRSGMLRMLEMVQRAWSVNHRMHNKAWIADGRVAIVGGRNIGEEYFSARPDVNFRDLDLLLAGPASSEASTIFDAFWNSEASIPIATLAEDAPRQLQRLLRRTDYDAQLAAAQPFLQRVAASRAVQAWLAHQLDLHWTSSISIASDPPLKHKHDDRGDWLVTTLGQQLGGATQSLRIISPYFVPGDEGTRAMTSLVAGGTTVDVVTNSLAANDVAAVHSGYMRYRRPLLRGGVGLHELKAHGDQDQAGVFGSSGASLHTKAFLADGRRGFVGSFNLDPRSAYVNTEMGVFFDDAVLGAQLEAQYQHLVAPGQSYLVQLDQQGDLQWLDTTRTPPDVLTREPDTRWWERALSQLVRVLPIESQL